MKILLGCSNCSAKKFAELEEKYHLHSGYAIQKYILLLVKGFAANGAAARVLSGLPLSRSITSKVLVHENDETECGVEYHYITTLNLPVLRQLMVFFGAFFGVITTKKTSQTFAVFDCLNIACAYGMALASRLRRIPTVAIVTDLPDMEHGSGLLRRINNRLFKKTDAFILLTGQMNSRVNPSGKPYIVLEGHVDSEAPCHAKTAADETKNGKKIIMYAGSIHEKYGIKNLVDGFLSAKIPDAELWVYGDGDYLVSLESEAARYPQIKYMGLACNAEIVNQEQAASLLVNPRPTAQEFTKYSFPSKNMEYMVSGTPVLTTKLPGMPPEYIPYVYLLEDESPEGVCRSLKEILALSPQERLLKGESAREFVLSEKSNVVQAKKILDFLSERVIRI